MKTGFLAILFCLSLAGLSQNNHPGTNEVFSQMFAHSRGDNDLLIARREFYWENNQWTSRDSTEFYYNEEFLLSQSISKRLIGYSWTNHRRKIYSYDIHFNQIMVLIQDWENDEWVNAYKDTCVFDSNNNKISELHLFWQDSVWKNGGLMQYDYDNNHNLIHRIQYSWWDSAWKNFVQYFYEFNSNHDKTYDLSQFWEDSIWVNLNQTIYEYDSNYLRTLLLQKRWIQEDWENHIRWLYEYDSNNLAVLYRGEEWDGNSWINYYLDAHTYDEHANLIEEFIEKWENNAWINDYRVLFYYEIIGDVEETEMQVSKYYVFPNPGSGKFTINNSGKIEQLEIFNVNGVPVYKNHSGILKDANPTIDISHVDKGIYFIRIFCDEEIFLQKVLIY